MWCVLLFDPIFHSLKYHPVINCLIYSYNKCGNRKDDRSRNWNSDIIKTYMAVETLTEVVIEMVIETAIDMALLI